MLQQRGGWAGESRGRVQQRGGVVREAFPAHGPPTRRAQADRTGEGVAGRTGHRGGGAPERPGAAVMSR